jgi:release factor glutamine methyltransferase
VAQTTLDRSEVVRRLRNAGCVFAEDEARLLLAEASEAPGADERRSLLEAMLLERTEGVPLEHVLGWTRFAGRRVTVNRGVFVPRRRTELLAAEAAALCPPTGTLVELCCGSAAVAATVARRLPLTRVYAADIEPAAVRCARTNLGARGIVLEGDLFDALPEELLGGIDVIVANAPYVPTGRIDTMPAEAREHEPAVALDGGPDGLAVQRRIVAGAAPWLRDGGRLLIETSAGQAPGTRALFAAHGLRSRQVHSRRLDATIVVGRAGSPHRHG